MEANRNTCPSCDLAINETFMKCHDCNKYFHYICTKLPINFIFLIKHTQRKYTCDLCTIERFDNYILESDNIEEEINKHTNIMRQQTAPIDSDVTNNNTEDTNTNNDETNNVNSVTDITVENHDTNINNGVDNSSTHSNVSTTDNDNVDEENMLNNQNSNTRSPGRICKFYARANCRHGRSGHGCNFSHPRICHEYMNNNCSDNHCNYYHPNLCKYTRMNKPCTTFRCRFYHTNGLYQPRSPRFQRQRDTYGHHNSHQYHDENTYSNNDYTGNNNNYVQHQNNYVQRNNDYALNTQNNSYSDNADINQQQAFLGELKSAIMQIQNYQSQLSQELQQVKSQIIQAPAQHGYQHALANQQQMYHQ